jgi:hypothetical protein
MFGLTDAADAFAAIEARIAQAETRIGRRIGWPAIVQYRYQGELQDLPPSMATQPGVQFDTEIHDLAAYEELFRSGRLRMPQHRGQAARPAVDGRPTS